MNFSEILRVIDSLQLTDRLPYVATPANWVVRIFANRQNTCFSNCLMLIHSQPGEKVMILPNVEEDLADKLFPNGIDRVGMPSGQNYVRTTTNY